MSQALISIIIPTYNRSGYILEAVRSALAQTYAAVELIVVDDGSTDETAQILAPFAERLQYHYQENRGIGAARNRGVSHSTGDFLAFLDDDDIWCQDKLRLQMEVFQKAPDTDAVYCHAEQFASPELDTQEQARFRHMAGKFLPMPTACALLIRRSAFDRVGPFNESLRLGIEMDWYARLCEQHFKTTTLDAVLFRRRLHRSNLNITHANEQSERLHVLKMVLDRRRQTPASG